MAPIFHCYDPTAIATALRERTITVTDIPLFSASELVASFKRHGIIEDYRFKTPKGSNFQQADIVFEDAAAAKKFGNPRKWCTWSQGHCLRICPAVFSK